MRKLVFLLMLLSAPAAAHDYWEGGEKVDPQTKARCCNGSDTKIIEPKLVKEVTGGFQLLDTNEFIPFERVQPSPDENIYVSRWVSSPKETKCFFYPYSF